MYDAWYAHVHVLLPTAVAYARSDTQTARGCLSAHIDACCTRVHGNVAYFIRARALRE